MIKIYDVLPSTNTYLKDNYRNYNDFDVVRAIKQTNGRGRFDRVWESNDDLTFSILFKNKEIKHHLIAPLSILNTLKEYNIKTTIKWPNDIYLNGVKISGILIESIYNDEKIDVVGIGINFSKRENFDYLDKYCLINKEEFLNKLIEKYEQLINSDSLLLKQQYLENNLIMNKEVLFNNELYKVVDINELGELVVKNNDGLMTINANELDIIKMKISV